MQTGAIYLADPDQAIITNNKTTKILSLAILSILMLSNIWVAGFLISFAFYKIFVYFWVLKYQERTDQTEKLQKKLKLSKGIAKRIQNLKQFQK